MKKFIVGSGWKMYKTNEECVELASRIKTKLGNFSDFPIVIFPPFVALDSVHRTLTDRCVVKIGAQNMHWEDEGPYTGEISARMLTQVGCRYVEINHQERRKSFHETNHTSHLKLQTALRYGLIPFLCIGEETAGTAEETIRYLDRSLRELLDGVDPKDVRKIVFAYEPRWAIGQEKSADLGHIESSHRAIRRILKDRYGERIAEESMIVYGGGIRIQNSDSITVLPDVNGLFTTGCGLDADLYSRVILNAAAAIRAL